MYDTETRVDPGLWEELTRRELGRNISQATVPTPPTVKPTHIGWKYGEGPRRNKTYYINTDQGPMLFSEYAERRGLNARSLDQRYTKCGGNSKDPRLLDEKYYFGAEGGAPKPKPKPKPKPTPKQEVKPATPATQALGHASVAVAAMQGLISSTRGELSPEMIADLAWDYAGAFIKRGLGRGMISISEAHDG